MILHFSVTQRSAKGAEKASLREVVVQKGIFGKSISSSGGSVLLSVVNELRIAAVHFDVFRQALPRFEGKLCVNHNYIWCAHPWAFVCQILG